jgi:hypothetical protein
MPEQAEGDEVKLDSVLFGAYTRWGWIFEPVEASVEARNSPSTSDKIRSLVV